MSAVFTEDGNFQHHDQKECGEHRTLGSHRSWCHECSEYCYPRVPCRGCEIPALRADLDRVQSVLKASTEAQARLTGEVAALRTQLTRALDALRALVPLHKTRDEWHAYTAARAVLADHDREPG